MKQKILSTALVVIVIFIIPLLGKPGLIFQYKILIMISGCALVFLTQPAIKLKEAQANKAIDLYSVYLILISSAVGLIATVVEWAYFSRPAVVNDWNLLTTIGITMVSLGIFLRIWAIQVLGKYFTATVQTQDAQTIITNGPYKLIRHPSYLGAYISIVGGAIFLESLFAFVLSGIMMLNAYRIRISIEETALNAEFKEKYIILMMNSPLHLMTITKILVRTT